MHNKPGKHSNSVSCIRSNTLCYIKEVTCSLFVHNICSYSVQIIIFVCHLQATHVCSHCAATSLRLLLVSNSTIIIQCQRHTVHACTKGSINIAFCTHCMPMMLDNEQHHRYAMRAKVHSLIHKQHAYDTRYKCKNNCLQSLHYEIYMKQEVFQPVPGSQY